MQSIKKGKIIDEKTNSICIAESLAGFGYFCCDFRSRVQQL
jgi:hypothetical protein